MAKDSLKMILHHLKENFCLELFRKKHPDYLFQPMRLFFPDTIEPYSKEDTLITFKTVDNQKVFVERKNPGVVETSIIPIRYYGNVSKQIALLLQDEIVKREDFYKVFLSSYDSIVLGDFEEYKNDSNKLWITDYDKFLNSGFPIEKRIPDSLIQALMVPYPSEIASRVRCCMSSSYGTSYFGTVHAFYTPYEIGDFFEGKTRTLVDLEEAILFCIQTENYVQLKKLLDAPDKMPVLLEIMDLIKENNRYKWLNELLESEVCSFVQNNLEFLSDVLQYCDNFSRSRKKEFSDFLVPFFSSQNDKDAKTTPFLSKDDIISLVKEFFMAIDTSNDLLNFFLSKIDDGSILIFEANEIEVFQKLVYEKYGYLDDISSPFYSSLFKFACIPLENKWQDVVSIVHEVLHYYSDSFSNFSNLSIFSKKNSYGFFTEFPSIYFEKLVVQFLLQKNYSSQEIETEVKNKIFHHHFFSMFLRELVDLIQLKQEVDIITPENILTDEKIEKLRQCNKEFVEFISSISDENNDEFSFLNIKDKLTSAQIRNMYCDENIQKLLKGDFILSKEFAYPIGVYLTALLDTTPKTIETVLDVSKLLEKVEITDTEILNQIVIGINEFTDEKESIKTLLKK